MHLNHPQTISHPILVNGKIIFHKAGSWCQKGWGLLFGGIQSLREGQGP